MGDRASGRPHARHLVSAAFGIFALGLGLSGCSWPPYAEFSLQQNEGSILVMPCDDAEFSGLEVSVQRSLLGATDSVWSAAGEGSVSAGDAFVLFEPVAGMIAADIDERELLVYGLMIQYSDERSDRVSRYDSKTLSELGPGEWLRWDETVADTPCPAEER